MDVRCPQCDTLYEVDARRLRGGASTLKCSQCEHIFHLQTHAALVQENQRRWMVRSIESGDIRYFLGFDELHQWILRGTVGKIDEISRTGKRWKCLKDVGEFMPIFQAAESISNISNARADSAPFNAEKPNPAQTGPQKPERPPVTPPQPDTRRPTPIRSNPARSNPVRSNPAGQGSEPRPRIQTSQQFGAPSSGPTPPRPRPTPLPPQPAAPGPPSVRIQPGAFDGASNDARPPQRSELAKNSTDDDWSFGDMPLGVAEGRELEQRGSEDSGPWRGDSGLFAQQGARSETTASFTGVGPAPAPTGAGRRVATVSLVVLLLGGAALGTLYFTKPALLEEITGLKLTGRAPETKQIARNSPPEPPATTATVQSDLDSAVESAEQAARAAQAERVMAGVQAARPAVFTGIQNADSAAQNATPREPTVDELLTSANRALISGNAERARKKFHQVLAKDRTNVAAITGLGWALLAVGNTSSGAAQFKKAIAFNPGYGDAYIGLGKAERDMGNHAAALKAYQSYLDRSPAGPKASIARYQIENLKGKLGE